MILYSEFSIFSCLHPQLFCQDLAPGPRGGAEIDDPLDIFEDLKLVIDLEELEGTPGPPALLLGESVVHVTFVLIDLKIPLCIPPMHPPYASPLFYTEVYRRIAIASPVHTAGRLLFL